MRHIRTTCFILLTMTVLAGSASAVAASGPDHRGRITVCRGGWVEHAPADRPLAPAYVGDTFIVERRAYATVHHSNNQIERFAEGKLAHRQHGSDKPTVYHGWISTHALHCS